jgi:peptide/nickel transport system substrate-binding protein
MTSARTRYLGLAVAVLSVAGLAACSSSSKSPASTSGASSGATPVYGGTLNIVAASGPDHIDTVPAYYTADYQIENIYARQLLSYPAEPYTTTTSPGWVADVTPTPDVATAVPTVANGGITNNGLTYTFHIKPGVDWDSTPARQVTSQDFVREYLAFCNPVSPVGNESYYAAVIKGFTAYCNAETNYFANAKQHPPTAANIAAFQNSNSIAGITTPNSMTIQFTLTQPASDFLYMVALPFASARPVEYDSYVPNSLQLDTHTLSDGPYQITSYLPGKSITLSRNSAWKQSSDTLRHQYVSKIVMTLGVTSAQTQLSDMEAGTEDLINDTPLNAASIPQLESSGSSQFNIWPWSSTEPYMAFNLRSPDDNGAMGKLLVRQAIEYGVSKVAVQKAYGGPAVGQILNTVIMPGNVGYVNYNLYPDNNGQGNVAMCKSDLAKAGYPKGLSLIYMYPNDSSNTRAFEAIQASLALCGVTLQGKPEPGASIFTDLGDSPVNNKAGQYDIGQPAWIPDWFGNNGRTIVQALFEGPDCVINTVNYGCYDNPAVNNLISEAEAATSTTAAGNYWHQADEDVMADAVIVPLFDQGYPMYSSARVRSGNYKTDIFTPNIGAPDLANVWLTNG